MNPLTLATAFFQAVAEFFGWKKKVDLTPEQKAVQQVRKERDEQDKAIDRVVNGELGPDGLRRP